MVDWLLSLFTSKNDKQLGELRKKPIGNITNKEFLKRNREDREQEFIFASSAKNTKSSSTNSSFFANILDFFLTPILQYFLKDTKKPKTGHEPLIPFNPQILQDFLKNEKYNHDTYRKKVDWCNKRLIHELKTLNTMRRNNAQELDGNDPYLDIMVNLGNKQSDEIRSKYNQALKTLENNASKYNVKISKNKNN